MVMFTSFHDSFLKKKDNEKSIALRIMTNEVYRFNPDAEECLVLYNKSLRYAIYDSENYAIILANRSAMLFALSHYKECIDDINLCLGSKYPKVLKPKVYLRKCESYKKLGDQQKLKESAEEYLLFLNKEVPKGHAELFKQKLNSVLHDVEEVVVTPSDETFPLPVMEPNPELPNASTSVMLKKNQNNAYYVSREKIAEGQVLFVEKAYTFAPYSSNRKQIKKDKCQYCLKCVINGLPCKACVKYMFCSEVCRDSAWSDFHQWECIGIQADIFRGNTEMRLALRIIFKACLGGFQTSTPQDGYYTIDNLPVILHNKEVLQLHAENAMLFVTYLKQKTDFFEYVKRCLNFSNKSYKDLMATIGGLIIRHTSQMQSKALYVSDFCEIGLEKVGAAVCPSVTGLSHSCDPNTIYYFYDDTVVFRALADIDANTKLTYSYNNITSYRFTLADRKQLLWDACKLRCDCAPCLNPLLNLDKMDSYICITCGGPAHLLDPELEDPQYKCLQCSNTFVMPPLIKRRINYVTACMRNFSNRNNVPMVKKILIMSKTFLNPYHMLFEQLYRVMMIFYATDDNAYELCKIYKMWIDYSETRYGIKSMKNVSSQIISSLLVLECLEKSEMIVPNHFIHILNSVKITLEKVAKLVELLYPPLWNNVKRMEQQRLDLHLMMNRLNASNNSNA